MKARQHANGRDLLTPAPWLSSDLVGAGEADALDLLRRAYRRDVEAIAETLKARLLTGEFSGSPDGNVLRFDALEAICQNHRRASAELARVTLAVCSERTLQVCWESGPDATHAAMAAFCLAYDVRQHAIRRWHAPRDGYFDLAEKEYARGIRGRRS